MKKEYTVGVDNGFGEDKKITALIFKSEDSIDENENLVPGQITKIEVFESSFASDEEVETFKEILSNDLDVDFAEVEFNLIPRGNLTPESERVDE